MRGALAELSSDNCNSSGRSSCYHHQGAARCNSFRSAGRTCEAGHVGGKGEGGGGKLERVVEEGGGSAKEQSNQVLERGERGSEMTTWR